MCQHDKDCHAAMLQQTQIGKETVRLTFSRAANLLRVADMATWRIDGIQLQDVADEFGCCHRTVQRMMSALEAVFPKVSVTEDEQRRWLLAVTSGPIECEEAIPNDPGRYPRIRSFCAQGRNLTMTASQHLSMPGLPFTSTAEPSSM